MKLCCKWSWNGPPRQHITVQNIGHRDWLWQVLMSSLYNDLYNELYFLQIEATSTTKYSKRETLSPTHSRQQKRDWSQEKYRKENIYIMYWGWNILNKNRCNSKMSSMHTCQYNVGWRLIAPCLKWFWQLNKEMNNRIFLIAGVISPLSAALRPSVCLFVTISSICSYLYAWNVYVFLLKFLLFSK